MKRDDILTLAEIYVGRCGWSDEEIGMARDFLRGQSTEDVHDFVRSIINHEFSTTKEHAQEIAARYQALRGKSR